MKKTLISVIAITSLVTVSLVALKCRLKPPKKEVFNFDEPLKEEEQEVLDENRQLKYDTQNKIEEIKLQIDVLSDLRKKFPLKPDQFEERILSKYDARLSIALDSSIEALNAVQLFIDNPLKKMTFENSDKVLNSILGNVTEIAHHLSIYDSLYPLKVQYCLKDILGYLKHALVLMEYAESDGMLLTSSFPQPIDTDENEEADFFSEKAKMILSNKEDSNKAEIKVLGYIIRQVIQAHEQGADFIVFKNFKYFKKQRYSYLYLVKHADEIEQSKNILRVVVKGIYVAIYFERN